MAFRIVRKANTDALTIQLPETKVIILTLEKVFTQFLLRVNALYKAHSASLCFTDEAPLF